MHGSAQEVVVVEIPSMHTADTQGASTPKTAACKAKPTPQTTQHATNTSHKDSTATPRASKDKAKPESESSN